MRYCARPAFALERRAVIGGRDGKPERVRYTLRRRRQAPFPRHLPYRMGKTPRQDLGRVSAGVPSVRWRHPLALRCAPNRFCLADCADPENRTFRKTFRGHSSLFRNPKNRLPSNPPYSKPVQHQATSCGSAFGRPVRSFLAGLRRDLLPRTERLVHGRSHMAEGSIVAGLQHVVRDRAL